MRLLLIVAILISIVSSKTRSDSEIYDIVKFLLKEHNVERQIIMPKNDGNKSIPFLVREVVIPLKTESNQTKKIELPLIIPTKDISSKNRDANSSLKRYYKIIKLKPKGWVIVSTEDIASPILGYSFDSEAPDDMPIEFKAWLDAINKDIAISKEITYKDNIPLKDSSHKRYIYKAPLLANINLSQMAPYNIYTPKISGVHAPVGCVATAFAQIMKYYRWPKASKGSHSYTWNNQRLYANFNTSYDYNSPISIARLSYNLGIAFEMDYGLTGSGTIPTKSRLNRVAKSFGYIIPPLQKRDRYLREQWDRMIKESIDRGHPIYYQGLSNPTYGGHAFVLDGYSYENNIKMYHFNWGWSGYYNGWFTLDPVRGYSLIRFPYSQRAIFNIRPNRAFNPSHNKGIKREAIILSPKNNTTINSKRIAIEIKRNSANRVKLLIYSYKKGGYIYNRYINRDKIQIDIPDNESKLKLIAVSYDKNRNEIGRSVVNIFIRSEQKREPKKALINDFKENYNNLYEIKWSVNSTFRVKLIIYSYTLQKYIYQGFVKGNKKIVEIPSNAGEIIIALYSYDKNNRYIDRNYIYKTINKSNNKELILYPKNNKNIYSKSLVVKLNRSYYKKIRVAIYSHNLKRYIFKKYITSSKLEFTPPLNRDKLYIIAQAIFNNRVIKESKVLIEFHKIAKIVKFKSYKYHDGHSIYIKVDKSGNKNVKLGVYSYTNKRYLFFKDVKKDEYYLFIPKEDRCLVVQLVTYDNSGEYKNQDDIFLNY